MRGRRHGGPFAEREPDDLAITNSCSDTRADGNAEPIANGDTELATDGRAELRTDADAKLSADSDAELSADIDAELSADSRPSPGANGHGDDSADNFNTNPKPLSNSVSSDLCRLDIGSLRPRLQRI